MSFGLRVMNADGSIAISTALYGLSRVVHDEVIVMPAGTTSGYETHLRNPPGFDSTKPGHTAIMVKAEGYEYGFYQITYPDAATVRLYGGNPGYGVRLLVFIA